MTELESSRAGTQFQLPIGCTPLGNLYACALVFSKYHNLSGRVGAIGGDTMKGIIRAFTPYHVTNGEQCKVLTQIGKHGMAAIPLSMRQEVREALPGELARFVSHINKCLELLSLWNEKEMEE